MSLSINLNNNIQSKLSEYEIDNIYKKYLSQTNSEYESLIDEDPKKFYTVIKNSKIYENFTNTTKYKIFEKVCHMIKSINQYEISLGLDILDLIIPYTDTSLLQNTFTFSSINDTTFGLFLYSLEESKEIKIKTLKLISKYHKEIQAQNNFEYLLELINDEENEVRYEAINCLETLIPYVNILPYKTCEIIIFSLKEKNNKLRKLFMNLLSKMKLDIDQEKFEHILRLIKDNIENFPNDREKIFKFVKNFTKNNFGCLNDDFFIKLFNLEQEFLMPQYDMEDEDNFYIIKMVVFDTYLVAKNYKISFKIPSYYIKNLYHYQNVYPKIFEGILFNLIQKKIFGLSDNDKNGTNEKNADIIIDEKKYFEITNILMTDNKNSITYDTFYKYIKSVLINYNNLLEKKNINSELIKKIMVKIRLINIFLMKSSNKKNANNKTNNSSNNIKDLMRTNEIILKIFDKILVEKMNEKKKKKTELLKIDINSLLSNLSKEKTPTINIDKLEDYQIYSNIKRGNKFFPFVIEFHIIIYHVHNLLEFKKNKDKNEIFLKNIFECYFLLNDNNKLQKYEADLFKPECTISSSIEKDYITIKYKSPLFLTSIRNPRNGINEFLFILDFKDKSSYSCNNIRKIIFSIDI